MRIYSTSQRQAACVRCGAKTLWRSLVSLTPDQMTGQPILQVRIVWNDDTYEEFSYKQPAAPICAACQSWAVRHE